MINSPHEPFNDRDALIVLLYMIIVLWALALYEGGALIYVVYMIVGAFAFGGYLCWAWIASLFPFRDTGINLFGLVRTSEDL